jgi:hypothetical protein
MRILALTLLLAGCGALPPTSASGENVTTYHGSKRFPDALQGAAEYCARRGEGIRHVRTDGVGVRAVSTFACVSK